MTTFPTEMSTAQSTDEQRPSTSDSQRTNEQCEQTIPMKLLVNQSKDHQYVKVSTVVIVNNHRHYFS